MRPILHLRLEHQGIVAAMNGSEFVVGIRLLTGEEKDAVIRNVVDQFKWVAEKLSVLSPDQGVGAE